MCDLINSAQTRGHIELIYITASLIHLSTSAFSNLHLLTLFLSLFLVCEPDHI